MFSFLQVIKSLKRKKEGLQKVFLLMCLTRLWVSLIRISGYDGELKATLFWIENVYLLVNFSERYFVTIDGKILFSTQSKWRREHLHPTEWIYI